MDYLQLEKARDWSKLAGSWKLLVDRQFKLIKMASELPAAAPPPKAIIRGPDGAALFKCKETRETTEAGSCKISLKVSLADFEIETARLGDDVAQLPEVRDLVGIMRLWIKHGSPMVSDSCARGEVLDEYFPSLGDADAIKRRAFDAIDVAGQRNLEAAKIVAPPSVPSDDLSEIHVRILRAVYDAEAFKSDKLISYDKIAPVARADSVATADNIKRAGSDLVHGGFLKSKTGRGGGVWLTEKGRERCEQ